MFLCALAHTPVLRGHHKGLRGLCPRPPAPPLLSVGRRRLPVHSYSYDPHAEPIGVQAAQSLLVDPARVLADETEAGRGLMVAVVQLALTAGACSAA